MQDWLAAMWERWRPDERKSALTTEINEILALLPDLEAAPATPESAGASEVATP